MGGHLEHNLAHEDSQHKTIEDAKSRRLAHGGMAFQPHQHAEPTSKITTLLESSLMALGRSYWFACGCLDRQGIQPGYPGWNRRPDDAFGEHAATKAQSRRQG